MTDKQKFTRHKRWSLIIDAVGIVLVVISLIFIAYQTRQTAELASRVNHTDCVLTALSEVYG